MIKTFKNEKIHTIFLLVIASLFLMTGKAFAFGIGIQPSTVEMTVKPGDRHRQIITIGNVHKTKTISLTIGLADWSLDKNGKLVLSPAGDTERSAAEWIRFSPASVTLKPETSQDIIVEISVPYGVKTAGDHRFALLATTLLPELDERGDVSGVWNRYQLASLFYLTLSPSESKPLVKSVNIVDNNRFLAFEIKNNGNAHARLKGKALVKDENGKTIAETPLNTVVLDSSERNYKVKLDNIADLKKGEKYRIEFDLKNTFSPQTKFRAAPVEIKPIDFNAD